MTWCKRELSSPTYAPQEGRKYNVCQEMDSYSRPGFQCHMQAASILTFINKQPFIDEYETKNIELGRYSHEGYAFSLSKDNAIIKRVTISGLCINNSAALQHQRPLMAPQRSRNIFVTIHIATQQDEETSCALEKLEIPFREEEKEDNLIFKSKGGAHTHEK